MDANDLFGEHIFNEREPVSCHDVNPVFDDLVDLHKPQVISAHCFVLYGFHNLGNYGEDMGWNLGMEIC